MKTNIALIGFMGTGKTAVGRLLAKKLGRKFIELDSLIEQAASKPILEIFEQDGEIAFRELEIEATKKIAREQSTVIAAGGGIVLNKINIDRLRESSRVVYLTASPSILLRRVSSGKNKRPLLNVPDQAAQIRAILQFRKPFYQHAADITIDTSKLDVTSVAKQIVEKLRQDESFHF